MLTVCGAGRYVYPDFLSYFPALSRLRNGKKLRLAFFATIWKHVLPSPFVFMFDWTGDGADQRCSDYSLGNR